MTKTLQIPITATRAAATHTRPTHNIQEIFLFSTRLARKYSCIFLAEYVLKIVTP